MITEQDENRIETMWLDFNAHVMPVDAGPNQIRDMRRAFWSGCFGMFIELQRMMDSGPGETEDDLRRMSLVDAELKDYMARLKAGKE